MSIAGPGKIIQDGLVLYLDASNTKSYPGSGTTWTDISRVGNNGTLTNGPTFNIANGGSIVFDGTNDYVNCGSGGAQSGDFTVSSWFKRNGPQSGVSGVIFCRSGANPDYKQNFLLSIFGATNYARFSTSIDTYKFINSTTVIADNIWYEITGTYNSSTKTLQIYINGVLENSTTITTNPPTDGSQLITLGSSDGTVPGNFFKGNVAAAKLYNRLLSSSEVLQNYNVEKKKFGLS